MRSCGGGGDKRVERERVVCKKKKGRNELIFQEIMTKP